MTKSDYDLWYEIFLQLLHEYLVICLEKSIKTQHLMKGLQD